MTASRRWLLKTGGAAAVIGGLGVVGYAHGPGMKSAREPWRVAGTSFGDPRLDALAYGILAPNPHNRQPWTFELVATDRIDVRCDLDRRLPHTDPFDRQITIGFGCMLELVRQAAAEKGWRAEIVAFPDGAPQPRLDGRRVATVTFAQDASVAKDPLFAHVVARRSLKEPYDPARPVTRDTLSHVIDAAQGGLDYGGSVERPTIETMMDIADRAFLIEYETARTRRESIALMRIGNRAVAAQPDGIDLGGVPIGLLRMTGIMSPEALDTPGTTSYETGKTMYRDGIRSSQGFIWIKATENTRASQIAAGRDWVRMNLAAQKLDLGVHPLSQCLQEFPEMNGPYADAQRALDVSANGVIHMLGRVGYAKFTAPSPRWPLMSKVVTMNE